ncbi:MAG: hypothetical protein WBQ18_04250 [Solirubrobacteraceae bacterium]
MGTQRSRGPIGVRVSVATLAVVCVLGVLAALVMPGAARAALNWSGPVGHDSGGQGSAISAVACAQPGTCVAATQAGSVVTFDSGTPAYSAPQRIDSQPPTGLTCVNAGLCVAVDGAGNRITFNPGNPVAAITSAIDPGHSFTGVACVPQSTECVGVDATGYAVTFDASAGGGGTPMAIDTGLKLIAVTCVPPGLAQDTCVAIDSADKEIQFTIDTVNQTPTVGAIQTVDSTANSLTAVSCPSITQCLAFDNVGHEMSTNPQAPATPQTTVLDPGQAIVAATCPSAQQCDAVDIAGNALVFVPGQTGSAGLVDGSRDLAGIACPSQCVSGDGTGHIHDFTPGGGGATSTLIDAQAAYAAVACASASQCTGIDNFGEAATFDPGGGTAASVASIDAAADIVYALACPSLTQCTAVDDLGKEATFNPQAPSGATPTAIVTGHPLLAVACPLTDQCTAVDDDRYAATFDPQQPTAASYVNLGTPAGTSLVGIACPGAGQCTVLDGSGDVVTYDPQSPHPSAPRRVLPSPGIAVACPSLTECVAVDSSGDRATFDPQTGSTVHTAVVSANQPAALSCPSANYCVTLDTSGQAVEFDPAGAGATAVRPIGDPALVSDLACPTISRCVAVDYAAAAFTATQTIPGAPGIIADPSIAGHLVAGDLLTARMGRWRNAPSSFVPRWERCAASGRSCRTITGATAQTYRLTRADIGHALRVAETASNPLGPGAPATSRATRAVAGPPAGPAVSRARLSLPRRGVARLTLDLTAARYGPQLRTVTVRLPAGVAVDRRGPSTTVRLEAGRRSVRGTLRRSTGGFAVTLRRPSRTLGLTIAGPRLIIAGGLAARIRGHRAGRLTLTVSVGRGRALRTTRRIAVSG